MPRVMAQSSDGSQLTDKQLDELMDIAEKLEPLSGSIADSFKLITFLKVKEASKELDELILELTGIQTRLHEVVALM